MESIYLNQDKKFYSIVNDYRFETVVINKAPTTYRVVDKPPIIFAAIEITDVCNLDCSYCFVDLNSKKKIENRFEILTSFIKELHKNHGLLRLSITGGEPFASKNIFPFLDLLKVLNIDFRIHSNGLLINSQTIEMLKQYPNLNEIEISIDHPKDDSELYSNKKNSIPKRLKIIEELINNGIRVITSTVITDKFIEFANEMMSVLENIGISTWRLREQLYDSKAISHFTDYNSLVPILKEISNKNSKMSIYGYLYDTLIKNDKYQKCKYTEEKYLLAKYNGNIQWMCGINLFAGNYFKDSANEIAKRINEYPFEFPIPKRCPACAGKFTCVKSPFNKVELNIYERE